MAVAVRCVVAILSVVVPLAGGVCAAADTFPLADDPVLGALVAEALEKSPELRAVEQSAVAARARVRQAGALPDPTLGVGYQNGGRGWSPGADDDTGLELSASQALPFPGKRRLARQLEEKQAARVVQSLERTRHSLVYRIRRAYGRLLLARENLELIEEQRRAMQDIEELTRSRYAVGLAGQPDVLRPQAELARLRQMRLHEEGNVVAAVAELNGLLARPAGTAVAPGTRLSALAGMALSLPSAEAVVAHAEQASALLGESRLAVERARAALELARRSLKPDFVVGGAYLERGGLPSMWKLDVGIQLPLYASRKQRQAIAENEALVRAAEASHEGARLSVRAMAERNLAELEAAVREADAYTRGVLVVDGLAVESALASYQAGKVPFVSVLEAFGTLYKDRWEYADRLYHVLWHSASLDEYAAGE
jgi:outer membrane protein TolC